MSVDAIVALSWTLLVIGAYLLGSVSWSLLIVRARLGADVRHLGSGNAGASNVLRIAGFGPGLAVLVLDMAKGMLPVLAARALGAPGPVIGAVALAVVAGHVFPVWHGFRGGKGVATLSGVLLCLALVPAALAILVFLTTVLTTRYIGVGSIVGMLSFPFLVHLAARLGWSPAPPLWLDVTGISLALLVIIRHRANIRRLRAGTEHRLGTREIAQETTVQENGEESR